MEKVYLSEERCRNIARELEELKTKGREEIASQLKNAKDLGDLSENSEYQEAREEQFRLEAKINQLEEILRNAAIIEEPKNHTVVKIGSKVKVKKDSKESILFTIVGSSESKPTEGFISYQSPIGEGLLGKKVGDSAVIKTPKGDVEYKIVQIY